MYLKRMYMVFKAFIFGKGSWSVSTITNCRINAQLVIYYEAYKQDVVLQAT
jgi:hypothetical protein